MTAFTSQRTGNGQAAEEESFTVEAAHAV